MQRVLHITASGTASCSAPPPFNTSTLPHRGVCPPSELQCPACPRGQVKCPLGMCSADVRACRPNVVLGGPCDAARCELVSHCHVVAGAPPYACWEAGDSQAVAALAFSDVNPRLCGYCAPDVLSHYPCDSCCGADAAVEWNGTYVTNLRGHREGAIFMEGSRWVCFLADVARSFGLENEAMGIRQPPPPPPPPQQPDWTELARLERAAAEALISEDWNLS